MAEGIDPSQSLKGDVFHNIIVVFVPGFLGIFSWLLMLWTYTPLLKEIPNSMISWQALVVIAACLIAGMIFENRGADLEVRHWESLKRETLTTEPDRDLEKEWSEYLTLPTKYEVMAARYLGSLVTRIKFLLSFQPACECSISGFFVLFLLSMSGFPAATLNKDLNTTSLSLVSGVMALAILSAYGYTQGLIFDYVKLLANVRRDMISGVRELMASEEKQKASNPPLWRGEPVAVLGVLVAEQQEVHGENVPQSAH